MNAIRFQARNPGVWGLLGMMVLFADPQARGDVIAIEPIRDNTLFESDSGHLSNGQGQYLFTGRTAQGANSIRRGVLLFDIAGNVPIPSYIDSVSLNLNLSKTISGPQNVSLHRLTTDWGEGASNATGQEGGGALSLTGDATWLHTFYDTSLWGIPGGDYEGDASATQAVAGLGMYTWSSTPQLVIDVQLWLDNPLSNFGWIILGDESLGSTAKRFDSREHPTPANHPTLNIHFTPIPEPSTQGDLDEDGDVDDVDLNILLSAFDNPANIQNTVDLEVLLGNFGRTDMPVQLLPVPEPATFSMLFMGVFGLLLIARRKKTLGGTRSP